MLVSLRWLSEFIDLPSNDPADLSGVLAMVGHGVEGYEAMEADWKGVVVGRVTAIAPHPDADKIRVCQVDTGQGPEQIICGAWNFDEGAYVAVAKPGAVLPGDFKIGQRTIRGVESNGMICSESELGLGDDQAGIMVLDGEPELGIEFAGLVELPDVVFDLDITPNRPDAMSMVGIARDLAAYYGITYSIPERALVTVPGATNIEVHIDDPVGCRRFVAHEIRNVTVGASPLAVRHRLAKAGVRPISNVVDVTNYVMLELGQPLHAFDAEKIVGNTLRIGRASEGETLVTLDDETRMLTPDDLIIYDADGPTSMAGTMGGLRSEVSATTTSVLMEAASWDPPTIMYMSRRHGLRSEASARFERGVDPNLADLASQRASAMVADLAGGEILEGHVDEIATPTEPVTIELALGEVKRLLGVEFSAEQVARILTSLEMSVAGTDPMSVTVPTFRPDVTRPADLVEEIARIHGYDKFPETLPLGVSGGLTVEQRTERKLHQVMVGLGLSQAVTLPFVGEDDLAALGRHDEVGSLLTVKNPLREEESRLRPTMLPSLLGALRYNISYGAASVALFETGRVYMTSPDPDDERIPHQPARLAWTIYGPFGATGLRIDGLESDGNLSLAVFRNLIRSLGVEHVAIESGAAPGFHPGRTAAVSIDGSLVGHVGELHPSAGRAYEIPGRVAIAELDLAPLLVPPEDVLMKVPSVFPFVDFDLSFVLPDETTVAQLVAATSDAADDLLEGASVFDEFRGEGIGDGRRAIAIHFRLRSDDRTLSNEEVAPVRQAMIDAAASLGATLRGVA